MTLDDSLIWIQLGTVLWNCGLTAVLWLRKPGEDAARAVEAMGDEVEAKLRSQAQKITEICAHMEHMPTTEEIARLEGTMRQVNERISGLADGMKMMRSSLLRIDDYLMRRPQ